MIKSKIIKVNNKYYIKVIYHANNDIRLYILINNNNKKICESCSRDSFLIKVNRKVKLTNKIKLLVASI